MVFNKLYCFSTHTPSTTGRAFGPYIFGLSILYKLLKIFPKLLRSNSAFQSPVKPIPGLLQFTLTEKLVFCCILCSVNDKCNGCVGQDLCVPNVCPPFDVDKAQVRYNSFQGLTFTNSCTTSRDLSVRV